MRPSEGRARGDGRPGPGRRARVRVATTPTPPRPPPCPPPAPAHLCRIAVVGDARAGKTALARRIIARAYVDDDAGAGGVDSAASNASAGTSVTSYEGLEPALAEYHKKDIAIWEDDDEGEADGNGNLERRSVCLRVQLWDLNLHRHFDRESEPDSTSSTASTSSSVRSPPPIDIAPLLPLLQRLDGVIIVCRCPLPPDDAPAHGDGAELRALERQLGRWTAFLRDRGRARPRPITVVSLSCGDRAAPRYGPDAWRRLARAMAALCAEGAVDAWRVGTCVDAAGAAGPRRRHARRLEDMEDAVEATFVDVLRLHLKRTRAAQTPPR